MIKFILEIPLNGRTGGLTNLFRLKPVIDLHLQDHDYEFMAWGDPVCCDGFGERLAKDRSPEFIVRNLYGHYYYILIEKKSAILTVGNSLFGILPVYYHISNEKITVSESAFSIGSYADPDRYDKRFILETVLFNYSLFNNSILHNITLLPANSCITVKENNYSIQKHTEAAGLFAGRPVRWKGAIEPVTEKFLETTEKYLSTPDYACSLTGGFDGRTLAAAGLYHGRNFSAYSFGKKSSKDITIAETLSSTAGLRYNAIILEEEYVRRQSLECGKEFILNSSGSATFARAHYLHAAKSLVADNKYIVTGNFGSEILRAAHNTGQVISKNLFSIFSSDTPGTAIRLIEDSEEYHCLSGAAFSEEWESLKESICLLPVFNHDYSGLTRNQRFYVFVFEEIFRKYFGAEMVNQFAYLKNRTPYLDIDFLTTVLVTELAGIHSSFFEDNPLKRYRGQVFYAHAIRKAFPAYGKLMTDKGYKPDDLISCPGNAGVAITFLKKVIRKKSVSEDPNNVAGAWEANRKYWTSLPVSEEYFNKEVVKSGLDREILYKILSLSFVMNSRFENEKGVV